jgi:hypothetical protein
MMNDVFEKGYPSYEAIHGKQLTLDLYGNSDNGISWRPLKGKEPNWFWRKMQYLCFGNKWVKDDNV